MFYGCKLLKNSSDISNVLISKLNPITIIYSIKNKYYPVLKLFDEVFVKNNRNNCYILINNIRHELCKEIELNELQILKNKLEIKLIKINSITDMSYMFYNCSSLESIPDMSKWDMSNVTCISKMFVGCKCKSINIMRIEYKFSDYTDKIKLFDDNFVKNNKDKCYLLIYGKKYELCNVFLLNNQLKKKSYHLKIHLIETKLITNMSRIFYNCTDLVYLSDIDDWNMLHVTDISAMFCGCNTLKDLPDISKWDTKNVTNMSYMFCGCNALDKFPDISKWDTKSVTNMSYMFYNCIELCSLPDISNWDTKNVTNMSYMFCGCISLKLLPDISKWVLNKKLKKECIFKGVNEKIIPKKFQGCIIY